MELICLGRNGPYPQPNGATSGYLLKSENKNVLLDCGAGVFARMIKYIPFEKLNAVILSHLHIDHYSDLPMVEQAIYVEKFLGQDIEKLTTYMPQTPEDVFEYLHRENLDIKVIKENSEFNVGGINFSFCTAAHPIETYAVKAQCKGGSIVYTGDSTWSDALVPFCQNVDLLVCDANLPHKRWTEQTPHMSAFLAAKLANEANVKQLVLTHIYSKENEPALLQEAKDVFENTVIAKEGQVYKP